MKRIVLILILIPFLFTGALFAVMELVADRYQERTYREIYSPDGSYKLIISHYKQYKPYGVKGNIYIADSQDRQRKKVFDFFVDFIVDVDDYIKWCDDCGGESGFVYSGKIGKKLNIINPDSYLINTK